MKNGILKIGLGALLLSIAACASKPQKRAEVATPAPVEVKYYDYRIQARYPHSTEHYTQGLQYHNGEIWEGTGREGHSHLYRYRLGEERAQKWQSLKRSEFGEGITLLNGEAFFLTWTHNTAYVYDLHTGKELRTLRYMGEGWGLTSDGERLYFSDGSSTLRVLNPKDFSRERTIAVTLNAEPVEWLNELEWIEGKLWANVYLTDQIVIIDPKTGRVEGVVELQGLLPDEERTPQTDVLNGIAYDSDQKRILVTGKNWPHIYEIELIEK